MTKICQAEFISASHSEKSNFAKLISNFESRKKINNKNKHTKR